MSAFVQDVIVVLVVAGALAYALLRFSPRGLRVTLARELSRIVSRLGVSDANARRVEAKLATGGACGSCGDCRACATTELPPSTQRVIAIRPVGR